MKAANRRSVKVSHPVSAWLAANPSLSTAVWRRNGSAWRDRNGGDIIMHIYSGERRRVSKSYLKTENEKRKRRSGVVT